MDALEILDIIKTSKHRKIKDPTFINDLMEVYKEKFDEIYFSFVFPLSSFVNCSKFCLLNKEYPIFFAPQIRNHFFVLLPKDKENMKVFEIDYIISIPNFYKYKQGV